VAAPFKLFSFYGESSVKKIKENHIVLSAGLVIVTMVGALLLLPDSKRKGGRTYPEFLPAASTAEAAETSSWTQAVQRVKEDRGEPVGKEAKIEIPHQLRHYSDTRRFLATQVAEWREHRFNTPRDFVDLAGMINRGELTPLQPVSKNYILFGVGGNANTESFTRYENGKKIALYNESELTREYARISEVSASIENELKGFRQELSSLSKREGARRTALQARINDKEKSLKAEQQKKDLLDKNYGAAEKRQQYFADFEALESLARSFPDRNYKTDDARSRQEMKVRMLSVLRPEALKVLEEIAASYRQKFNRPLPVTSLVRPEEYQHELSKVNPNATRIDIPPHSTGLAFDINYRFMTAEEQTYVMEELALLKDAGRIEVLRENRNHYHVFAFIDGARPAETLIRESLGSIGAE
jgi:Skp family chaperone for outer membrane proteins